LNFSSCLYFFSDHAARFGLRASVACCEPQHTQSDDILRVETKLHSFESQREPWNKQKAPTAAKVGSTIIFVSPTRQ
jgi:hypothetical protein